MDQEFVTPAIRLFAAMGAGALIGLERTYHGRPAGFRTHTLVATASSLLMLLTVFSSDILSDTPAESIRIDPTRMAQGIMTGIGFLGAGSILKENVSIRGLTTAASIWITASIGILIGVGMYYPAGITEIIALGTLGVFRWFEARMPTFQYGTLMVKLLRNTTLGESDLLNIVTSHHLRGTNISYYAEDDMLRFEMTIRTQDQSHFGELANTLKEMESIREFSVVPQDT